MLIAGGRYVYVSTDEGDTWIQSNSITGTWKNLTIENSNIYAVNEFSDLVYRNTLSNVIGVEQISTASPINYQLNQNYPNPFNPSTSIEFDIQKKSNVTLKVYDMLGKEIAVLVNEQLSSGSYKTEWNASGAATGVYYYKLTASEYSETKKMILIK